MTDLRYTREALNAKAITAGWKPPLPSSDFATWCFQRLSGLQADGLAGPKTFEKMIEVVPFTLIECVCGHSYVRSMLQGSNWACPKCGEVDDVDNLIEVPGPERSLTNEEADALMGHGSALPATEEVEKTLDEHAVELADQEWAEYKRGELAYVPDNLPCITVFQELAERLGHRINQQEVDQFTETWTDRIEELKTR